MRIGELAELAGTSTRALRYYEAQGLLRARRRANGYRDYGEDDLRVVREIRSLLALGFGLQETRPFVECLRDGHESGDTCPDSIAVYRRKLAELDGCLERMHAVRDHVERQLTQAVRDRAGGPGPVPSEIASSARAGFGVPVAGAGSEPRCFFSAENGDRYREGT